jgi:hypothetical protein
MIKGLLMAFVKKGSLRSFISREFFKAALLPLLIIEITLLALYFFMNTYLLDRSIQTLIEDRLSNLLEITDSQTRIISEQFQAVADLSQVLQAETERFFEHPEQFPVPEPAPEFGFAPNGVYYKLEDTGGCSLLYSGAVPVGAAEKEKALQSEALDPVYKGIFSANRNIVAVYLNTFDSMNRYYPFFEDVYAQTIPGMNIPEFNFYYLADGAHNPDRGAVWTDTYLDPMGMGWMMSCIVPVITATFWKGWRALMSPSRNLSTTCSHSSFPGAPTPFWWMPREPSWPCRRTWKVFSASPSFMNFSMTTWFRRTPESRRTLTCWIRSSPGSGSRFRN